MNWALCPFEGGKNNCNFYVFINILLYLKDKKMEEIMILNFNPQYLQLSQCNCTYQNSKFQNSN